VARGAGETEVTSCELRVTGGGSELGSKRVASGEWRVASGEWRVAIRLRDSGVTSPPIFALARLRRDDGNWWREKKREG
jgi:hypothetical protein